ncbi:MAG: DUF4358 domain-containing protein, partial [Allobaculum sp.]|nr:DUF4358 domain-containing protein [Allobaculum sp.]
PFHESRDSILRFMKNSRNPYIWIQCLLLAGLFLFLSTFILGGKINSSTPFEYVEQSVLSAVDQSLYPKQDNQKLRRYLNLDPAQALNISFYRLDDAMSANEIVLVQFDPASADVFESAIITRKDSQEQIYEGYAPEQAELMKNALIDMEENYALYYVGSNTEQVKEAFQQALKEN